LNDDVAHFVPPNLREPLGLLAQMNPVNDIYEAGGDLRDGDYIGAATNTAAAALPLAGAVAARPLASGLAQTGDDALRAIVDALTMYQAGGRQAAGDFIADESGALRLYHGSPHDFDRFSMDKIGTGEGAQAYGHGLYFAESEDVAREYRDQLAGDFFVTPQGETFDPTTLNHLNVRSMVNRTGDAAAARNKAMSLIENANEQTRPMLESDIETLDQVLSQGGLSRQSGHLYEVNVNANPEDFLDWDAPLSEQTGKARAYLDNLRDLGLRDEGLPNIETGRHLLGELAGEYWKAAGRPAKGADAPYVARVSEELRREGIPGIRYRDAGSRGLDGAEGTRNYVVFDENLIEIVRKYGIAGAAAMLGMSASDVEAQMAQQDNRQRGLLE
jgi:hypothetical protein